MFTGRQSTIAAEFEPAVVLSGRGSPLAPVSLDARLGRGGLDRTLCRVTDLSLHGAHIQTYSMLRRGSVLWLTLPGAAPIAARVAWSDDYAAGLAFDDPIPETVLDRLVDPD